MNNLTITGLLTWLIRTTEYSLFLQICYQLRRFECMKINSNKQIHFKSLMSLIKTICNWTKPFNLKNRPNHKNLLKVWSLRRQRCPRLNALLSRHLTSRNAVSVLKRKCSVGTIYADIVNSLFQESELRLNASMLNFGLTTRRACAESATYRLTTFRKKLKSLKH